MGKWKSVQGNVAGLVDSSLPIASETLALAVVVGVLELPLVECGGVVF